MESQKKLESYIKTLADYYDGFEKLVFKTLRNDNKNYLKLLDYIDLKDLKTCNEVLWYAINIRHKTI